MKVSWPAVPIWVPGRAVRVACRGCCWGSHVAAALPIPAGDGATCKVPCCRGFGPAGVVQNPLAVPELPLAGAPADLALLGVASRPLCVEGGLHMLTLAGDSLILSWSLVSASLGGGAGARGRSMLW